MPRRILLTGGAGFIGSSVLDALVALGHHVTVVDDFNDYYDPAVKRENVAGALRSGRVRLVEGDLRSPAVWDQIAPEEHDAVLHLAARAGVRPSLVDPPLYVSTNVEGTTRVLQWACRPAVPLPVVFASSSSVYGDDAPAPFEEEARLAPVSPYGATKVAGEELLATWRRMHGLAAVSLRFFTVYGPRQRPDLAIHKFARCIERGEAIPVFGDGSSARDYTHIHDIVGGVLAALQGVCDGTLEHPVYNLGSDRAIGLESMIATIEAAVGRRAVREQWPEQRGDVRRTWASITRSQRGLGYAPSVVFEDGVRDFVAWMRR